MSDTYKKKCPECFGTVYKIKLEQQEFTCRALCLDCKTMEDGNSFEEAGAMFFNREEEG